MRKCLIVTEKTGKGDSDYPQDLEDCVSTGGRTLEGARKDMCEALEFHLEGMHLEELIIPAPHSHSIYIEVPA